MAFDLDLIERALDVGAETATEVLAARERDFASAPEIGGVPACAAWVATVKEARAEFAKLRRAIEVAPHAQLFDDELNGFGMTPKHDGSAHAVEKQVRALHALVGHNVLLVKADD